MVVLPVACCPFGVAAHTWLALWQRLTLRVRPGQQAVTKRQPDSTPPQLQTGTEAPEGKQLPWAADLGLSRPHAQACRRGRTPLWPPPNPNRADGQASHEDERPTARLPETTGRSGSSGGRRIWRVGPGKALREEPDRGRAGNRAGRLEVLAGLSSRGSKGGNDVV